MRLRACWMSGLKNCNFFGGRKMDISELMELVKQNWQFDEEHYPGLPSDSDVKKLFSLKHVLYHQQKAVGKMAEAIEPYDHGKELNVSLLKLAVRNSFINTVRMACVLGITPHGLAEEVRGWRKENHEP